MADFRPFASVVAARFDSFANRELFTVLNDENRDVLMEAYLAAFPEGTNPIFKTKTEHDCACCRQFIRNIGGVVSIQDGEVHTVWGTSDGVPEPYRTVADAMDKLVKSMPIVDIFRPSEPRYGAAQTRATIRLLDDHGNPKGYEPGATYNHLHGAVAKRHSVKAPDTERGKYRDDVQRFRRGLSELKPDALDTVIDLIESKSLYRGEEHLRSVQGFRDLQRKASVVRSVGEKAFEVFLWENARLPGAGFRSSVIGTLVQDLSEDMPVEDAVKAFEKKVAPENYKRPTAVVTQRMVQDALKTIDDLGIETSLKRRLAMLSDVTVNNVLWVDRSAKKRMKGELESLLMSAVAAPSASGAPDNAEDITFDDLRAKVLPKAEGVELLLSSSLLGNFACLTAPQDTTAPKLFRWDNGFAWSYVGNIADSSLRKEVAARGGRVDGVFRFSHSWNHPGQRNASLMDLHVFMPGHSFTVEPVRQGVVNESYGSTGARLHGPGSYHRIGWNNRADPLSRGVQDVDYTAPAPEGYIPVENITFPQLNLMPEGDYVCKIHNWSLRQPTQGGFRAEIEFGGRIFQYEYTKPLKHHEWVTLATVTLKNGAFTIKHHIPCGVASVEKWGVKTETLVKVNTVLASPNHWDDQAVGNKHWFFILEGCRTDEPMRGIYNEFLTPELEKHRKVFEVLGEKTKCQPDANLKDQLSGLGFSSTKGDSVTLVVTTEKSKKTYNVQF